MDDYGIEDNTKPVNKTPEAKPVQPKAPRAQNDEYGIEGAEEGKVSKGEPVYATHKKGQKPKPA